jgi:hypothetical protein
LQFSRCERAGSQFALQVIRSLRRFWAEYGSEMDWACEPFGFRHFEDLKSRRLHRKRFSGSNARLQLVLPGALAIDFLLLKWTWGLQNPSLIFGEPKLKGAFAQKNPRIYV